MVDLEARILREGYGEGAWHGPELKGALADVTSATAFWRPAPGRHNIAEIALLELPTRLAKALLRFAVAEKHPTGRGALRVELSQGELGNICGSSRESINKCLGGWQRRGIIQIENGVILVMNRTALDELAVLAEPSNQIAV